MEENKVLLDVQGLKMHFPVRGKGLSKNGGVLKAVDDVSFSIQRGRTFGLVGESGCGKTTVGRTILKLYQATAGKVIYNGKDLTAMTDKEFFPMRRELQMIFQDPMTSLDPRQTVNEIVGGPLRLQKMVGSKKEQDERVLELLHMVGLKDDHANRYPHEFSGGQRQRIGIARALGLEPRFIVCDEPISALDVSIQAQVVNLLEDFQERLGLTYLFISHDLSMIRHISHQVGVMYLGHLVEVAEVEELYTNMRHPYTQSLMSAAPIADPRAAAVSQRIILEGDVPSPLNPPSGCPFRTRCRFATEQCAAEMPALEDIGGGHLVACHHML
ncbi:MAG: ATP-binding cassette domain-containing protein [Clostridia bacterium]|nr:ATP-binding cassette domain-containing protein [Clostridia bacterium]